MTRVGASEHGQQTSFKSLLILIRSGDIVLTSQFILLTSSFPACALGLYERRLCFHFIIHPSSFILSRSFILHTSQVDSILKNGIQSPEMTLIAIEGCAGAGKTTDQVPLNNQLPARERCRSQLSFISRRRLIGWTSFSWSKRQRS